MADSDPRRVVGNRVWAKACHVTNYAECARRYGSNSKLKYVSGIVIEVRLERSKNNRVRTMVVGEYDFGDEVKTACMNLRSVKRADEILATGHNIVVPNVNPMDEFVDTGVVNDTSIIPLPTPTGKCTVEVHGVK